MQGGLTTCSVPTTSNRRGQGKINPCSRQLSDLHKTGRTIKPILHLIPESEFELIVAGAPVLTKSQRPQGLAIV